MIVGRTEIWTGRLILVILVLVSRSPSLQFQIVDLSEDIWR